jgi:hypothetical protein
MSRPSNVLAVSGIQPQTRFDASRADEPAATETVTSP